jgi:hypothetical protein
MTRLVSTGCDRLLCVTACNRNEQADREVMETPQAEVVGLDVIPKLVGINKHSRRQHRTIGEMS